jgi:hypothetical protein
MQYWQKYSRKMGCKKTGVRILFQGSLGGTRVDSPEGIKFKAFMELLVEEMMKHKWIQSQKAGKDLGVDAEVEWIKNHAAEFRQYIQSVHGSIVYPMDFRQFMEMQVQQIMKHKYIQSEKAGRDLGREAELEWVKLHSAKFRKCIEHINDSMVQACEDVWLETLINWIGMNAGKLCDCFDNGDDSMTSTA